MGHGVSGRRNLTEASFAALRSPAGRTRTVSSAAMAVQKEAIPGHCVLGSCGILRTVPVPGGVHEGTGYTDWLRLWTDHTRTRTDLADACHRHDHDDPVCTPSPTGTRHDQAKIESPLAALYRITKYESVGRVGYQRRRGAFADLHYNQFSDCRTRVIEFLRLTG